MMTQTLGVTEREAAVKTEEREEHERRRAADDERDESTAPEPVRVGQWVVEPTTVGHGSRSKVKMGHAADDAGTVVALKRVDKKRLDAAARAELESEVAVLRALRHRHIVQLHDVVEDRRYVYMVFQHLPKDLYTYVSERRRLPEGETRVLFKQLASAVQHCHESGVCHRDIKLENVLVDRAGKNVYLADFGFATRPGEAGPEMTKYCGSPFTVAPEIVQRTPYSPIVDVWSLGVVLYGMVLGRFPFDEKTPRKLFQRIVSGRYHRLPAWVPPSLSDLLTRMLVVDPHDRITLPEVLDHNWLN